MPQHDLEERVTNLERKMEFVVTRDELAEVLKSLHSRFDKLENRFDNLENRVDSNGNRLDSLTVRFDSFVEEQRLANEATGKAWEKLDGQMTMAESDREQVFIRLDAIQTALENRGIEVD